MSEPLHAGQGENEEPRPDLTPDMQAAGDISRAAPDDRTSGWFRRTARRPAPHAVPRTGAAQPPAPAGGHAGGSKPGLRAAPGARPALISEQERLSARNGTHPLSLTWEEIEYFTATESLTDATTDYQYWHDTVLFDQAIDDDRYWRTGRLHDRPMGAEPEIDDPEIG